jgi:hypothetical protein
MNIYEYITYYNVMIISNTLDSSYTTNKLILPGDVYEILITVVL